MAPSANIQAVLTANSMRVHYMMMANGVFHNHTTQGIVGLHRLGASDERIQSFIALASHPDSHGGGVVKASEHGYDANETKIISDAEASQLLGKTDQNYYQLVNYYEHKLKTQYGGSIESFIKGEMKLLGDGILAHATHAVIEIGHGYSVGQVGMVVEGMAWLHHDYMPPNLTKDQLSAPFQPPGPLHLIEMLTNLSKDDRLKEKVAKATGPGVEGIYKRLGVLWHPESSTLLELVNQTNLEIPTDPVQGGSRLVDIALTLYIASRKRNMFFLLHGVTGAWSVKQILPLLDADTGRMCLRTFLLAILGMYVMEGSSPFDFSYLPNPGDLDVGWPEIVARTLAREDADPHCYKLVQVCHDLARSAAPEKQAFYKTGALVSLENKETRFESPVPN